MAADVLQRVIINACNDGLLSHPLVEHLPCPVIQYADDTLIICKANSTAAQNLISTLQVFSASTGLHINFDKSTFVPIHVEHDLATLSASILGCSISSFPQTYLGLPLSSHKLNLSAFHPIIAKEDKKLAGWRGKLLSIDGRAVLVRASLRSLLTHAMSTLLLPSGTIKAFDKRYRAFFWVGQEKVNGGQCKVAWETVCAPFSKGGGSRLHLFALSKPMSPFKHLAKVHCPNSSPWESRMASIYGWSNNRYLGDSSPLDSLVWKDLSKGLNLYRDISKVYVGNGAATAFWLDVWLTDNTLVARFPAIFSHSTRLNASVARVLGDPVLCLDLRPMISSIAEQELFFFRKGG